MLNNALDMLDQNNIHMLVWGSTRMSGFLDGCKQASSILVPFLDTIIAGNIRQEEAAYILSPKGLFVLQLFADLHPIFADQYLHCVDTDKVLSCEVYNIAGKTANTLISADITTPKADTIFNNLGEDINNNVTVRLIDVQGDEHTHILNQKLTRQVTLQKIKDEIKLVKKSILQNLNENILDQNGKESIYCFLTAFDLTSNEDLDQKINKLKMLFDIFGQDVTHVMPNWFNFAVHVTFQKKLSCTREQLVRQFEEAQKQKRKYQEKT